MNVLKSLSASLAVVALGAGLAATSVTPAAADPGAIIAGVIGGAALGAIVAGAASQNHYQAPTGYYSGAPAYQPRQGYQYYQAYPSDQGYAQAADSDDYDSAYRERCHVRQQPLQDEWGRIVGYRPMRVCR